MFSLEQEEQLISVSVRVAQMITQQANPAEGRKNILEKVQKVF